MTDVAIPFVSDGPRATTFEERETLNWSKDKVDRSQKLNVIMVASEPGIPLQVLICLEALGAAIHILAGPRAEHLRWSHGCDSFNYMDMNVSEDGAAQARILDTLAAKAGAVVILPSDSTTTRLLVKLRKHLSTPCYPVPDPQLYELMDDKWSFGQKMLDLGLSVPKTIMIGDKETLDVELIVKELGLPLVIKPTNQGNSNGVVIVRTKDDLRRLADSAHYPYNSLIAQEYIPGIDIDLSFLAINGRMCAWAVQQRVGKTIAFFERSDYVKAGWRIAESTGYNGVAHIDARLDERDGAIKLIECNPRFWGSITASLQCGINFVAAGLGAVCERPIPQPPLSIRAGKFTPPTALLASLARTPWKRELWSRSNMRGLGQMARNFIPYCHEEWHARRRRLIERDRTA